MLVTRSSLRQAGSSNHLKILSTFESKEALTEDVEAGSGLEEIPAVFCSHVGKVYAPVGGQRFVGTTAVHNLCLRIRKKECFSLMGTNGAGKTTTVK